MGIEATGTSISSDLIVSKLLDIQGNEVNGEQAFFNNKTKKRFNSKKKTSSNNEYKDIICDYCNKKGHIKKFCFSFKKHGKNPESAHNAFCAFYANETKNKQCWFLDSGASSHMTLNIKNTNDMRVKKCIACASTRL